MAHDFLCQRCEMLERTIRDMTEAQCVARMGSFTWDLEAAATTWSDGLYRMLGLERDALSPTFSAYMERVHPDDRERVDAVIVWSIRSGQPFELAYRVTRIDGGSAYIRTCGGVVRDEDGRALRVVGTCQLLMHEDAAIERRGASTRRPTVLVIFDEPPIEAAIGQLLSGDYDVTYAAGSPDALVRFERGERYHAVVVGVASGQSRRPRRRSVPQVNGLVLHEALLRYLPDQAARMIFVAVGIPSPTLQAALEQLPNRRFDKAFTPQQLRDAVRALVERTMP